MNKDRIDTMLVELKLAPSREKARSLIMAGVVLVDGKRIDKPGAVVHTSQHIEIKEDPVPFVSRGGLKLKKAIDTFNINLNNVVAADIGASTGGFTDCMLQHGAKYVYSIDVGYGQLDWKLRNDPRVCVMERTNARFAQPDWFPHTPDFASIDVSFISLRLILPPIIDCLTEHGSIVALVKPQFEAGRDKVGKHGVVRSIQTHNEILDTICSFAQSIGLTVSGLDYSPITGPKGNIEFLLFLKKRIITDDSAINCFELIDKIVKNAHDSL